MAGAVAGAAVLGEAHGGGAVAGERDEAEAVGNELVIEDGGVGLEVDEVDGHRRHLGEHNPPERVGHAPVGAAELELDELVAHFQYLHLQPLAASAVPVAGLSLVHGR